MSLRGEEYGTTIHTRAEWGARPPRSTTPIPDVSMVTVHYAGPSDWGNVDRSSPEAFRLSTNHARCDDIMRSHQNYHMDTKGWSDYAYNGSACPHGVAFIGRGRFRSAAQGTTLGNNTSYAIQYLGAGIHNGVEDPLTEPAKKAFIDFAHYLDQPLKRGHRDWKPTSCPGDPTYAWRLAGFPHPPKDWFDMATKAELDAVIKSNIDDIVKAVWDKIIPLDPRTPLENRHRAWVVLRDCRNVARRTEVQLQELDADLPEGEVPQT